MNIHLKIESKLNVKSFISMTLNCVKRNGANSYYISPIQAVKGYYNSFNELHGIEYKVQKLSKKQRRNNN
jgi:hypothetical protein